MKINLISIEEFVTVVDNLAQKLGKLDEILGEDAVPAKEALIKNMSMLEAQGLALSAEVGDSTEDDALEDRVQDNVNILNMLLLAGVNVRNLKALEAEKFSEPFIAFMESAVALRRAVRDVQNPSADEEVDPIEDPTSERTADPWDN